MAAVMADGVTKIRNAAAEPHVQDLCNLLNAMGGQISGIGTHVLTIEGVSELGGLPESFVGPMQRDVVMHEVGHTMGLMHNWKGSAQYDSAEINSAELKGVKSTKGTVNNSLLASWYHCHPSRPVLWQA